MKVIMAFALLCCLYIPLQAQKFTKSASFKVWGACEMCKERIEETVFQLGITTAEWNVSTQMINLKYNPDKISVDSIKKQLAKIGHDTKEFQAEAKVYQQLPACCHYPRTATLSDEAAAIVIKNAELAALGPQYIRAVVLQEDKKGKLTPLQGAAITVLQNNVRATTDSLGVFEIKQVLPVSVLITYVGFKPDTIVFDAPHELKTIVKKLNAGALNEVVVTSSPFAGYLSGIATRNSVLLGTKELTKAACCNLSESFETSPSVDVSYADAITGVKQIQLLGLSGNYSQLLTENVPEIRGLSGNYGLTFVPGPWLESIQITKGTGSVVNGYESIAGQINIEEKKPDGKEKGLINMYVNNMGRAETNINLLHKINDKWSTALLTHANTLQQKNDMNKDGFLDMPTGRQFNVVNRWKYTNNTGLIAQLAVKALNDKRTAGEVNFNAPTDRLTTKHYGVGLNVEQYNATAKIGYVFPQSKYQSVGLIVAAGKYNHDNYFGLTTYKANQSSLFAQFIYQSIIGNTNHKFRTGLSYMGENYHEMLNGQHYNRSEKVPGAFFEYTYSASDKLTAIAGVRYDRHNQFGSVFTPRLHLKYDVAAKTSLRLSAGTGFRMANILAENTQYLMSARAIQINGNGNYGYGLNPERAWNVGVNLLHQFTINGKASSLNVDWYYTRFTNQTVVDVDANPQKLLFYNLNGQSFANSFQAEWNWEIRKKMELRVAYRYLNVQTTYTNGLLTKPLIAPHRAFINWAYETPNKWKFDYTLQWIGSKRLPSTQTNPADKRMMNQSPSFFQMNAQISKQFGQKWEWYLGTENATSYMQNPLIIDAANPFSNFFDASMVWGPINRRVVYLGMRFKWK
ncbi:MAG: TonB-dependent receptor domain-containing protein [Chitinophagaceae bacterium]